MKTIKEYPPNSLVSSLLVIGCFCVVLGLTGCEDKGTAEKAGQKIDQAAENAHEKMDDAQQSIDQQAQEAGEYMDDSMDASKNAIATAGKQMDKAAAKAEKQIEGVKEVVIDQAATAGKFMDDSMITTTVKTALVNDALLEASQIDVMTTDGVVKLSGVVDSEESIARATAVVQHQKNVKSVQSELVVNPTPSNP